MDRLSLLENGAGTDAESRTESAKGEGGGDSEGEGGTVVRARTDLRVRGRQSVEHEGGRGAARAVMLRIKKQGDRFSCVSEYQKDRGRVLFVNL
jgi:hypothetical protein